MSYDSRLYIKQRFELEGQERINNLKMVEYADFVQLYVEGAGHWAGIRLDRKAIDELKEYLKNVEIGS